MSDAEERPLTWDHLINVLPEGIAVVDEYSVIGQANQRLASITTQDHNEFGTETGEFSMHYQPIVDLSSTEVVGFEALMRWQHPTRGWVSPSVFIPLAEQNDLILKLSSFALNEAVAAASTWERASAQNSRPYVTVNLSARQFHDPNLMSTIEGALLAGDLSTERLVIEITESVSRLNVAETVKVIERLDRLGIGVALGDFGNGYSSLSYLSLLHPRIIKVDQAAIGKDDDSYDNESLLESIVRLGRQLHMTVLAERLETQDQSARLRHLGFELGQGFLFSPAVPAVEAAAMVGRVMGD